MTGKNREIWANAVAVFILSISMAVALAFTWEKVYGLVVELEEWILPHIPTITSGLIQIVAMFGLGLYLSWTTLFTIDWRKRYQGALLLFGSLLVLLVLALFGHFLPQMVEHPVQNLVAFLGGLAIGTGSEFVRLPGQDQAGDLFYIEEVSRGPLRVIADGEEAEFPIAARGLYVLIVSVVGTANIALWTTNTMPFTILATHVVSGLYAVVLYRLIRSNITRGNLKTEIIGPRGSGKTLFFYGLDKTVRDYDNEYDDIEGNGIWQDKMHDIETSDDLWPTQSTEWSSASTFEFTFRYGKLNKQVKMLLHDFPGGFLDDIKDALLVRTDGGTTTEDETEEPNWGDGADQRDSDPGMSTGRDQKRTGSEESTGQTSATGQGGEDEQLQGGAEEAGTGERDSTDISDPGAMADELRDANLLLAILDTRKIIESGIKINPDNYPGNVGEQDEDEETKDKIVPLRKICDEADPDKGVILIATKTDLLLEKYEQDRDMDAPHTAAGDMNDFTDFVDSYFTQFGTYDNFKSILGTDTIYPVYFQTTLVDGEPEPIYENGKIQPEGYEQVLDAIIKHA